MPHIGNPKLVTLTHGSIAVIDNDRNIPVPKGRNHQNAAQFNFEGGGRFYSCFPPYHVRRDLKALRSLFKYFSCLTYMAVSRCLFIHQFAYLL